MSRVDNIISGIKNNGIQKKKSRVDSIIESSSNGNLRTGVDENYINSFLSDAQKYFSDASNDLKGIGYGNASSLYDNYSSKGLELRSQANTIRAYLNSNKGNIDESAYNDMMTTLNKFNRDSESISNNFRNYTEHFSKWETEEDYNKAVADAEETEKLLGLDTDALSSEIEKLKSILDRRTSSGMDEETMTEFGQMLVDKASNLKPNDTVYVTPQQLLDGIKLGGYREVESKGTPKYVDNQGRNVVVGTAPPEVYNFQTGKKEAFNPNLVAQDAQKQADLYGINLGMSNEELLNAINSKSKDLTNAKRLQRWKELESVIDEADFGEYKGVNTEFAEDKTYKFINDIDGEREKINNQYLDHATTTNSEGIVLPAHKPYQLENNYDKMSKQEIEIYNYLYATSGKDVAEEYLDSVAGTINSRKAEELVAMHEANGTELLFAVEAGLDQWKTGAKNLFNQGDTYYAPSAYQIASGTIRENLEEKSKGLGVAYDVINTTSNMLPSILTSTALGFFNPALGTASGLAMMGGSTYGNSYAEMLNLGYSKKQASAYATLTAGSEVGLSYLIGGFGKLGGKLTGNAISKFTTKIVSNIDKAFARIAIGSASKIVGNMMSEFGEEYLQEILTPVFKNITLGTNEEFKLYTPEAAYAGFLGALSAGMLEGGSTIIGEVSAVNQTSSLGKNVIDSGMKDSLVDFGKSLSVDSVAYKIADRVNEKTGAYALGKLLNEVGASLSETNMADIQKSLVRKGVSEQDAQTISKWLNAAVMGEEFSVAQISALEDNDVISQTFRDVILNQKSTVNQRTQQYLDIIDGMEAASKTETTASTENIESIAKEYEAQGMSPEEAKIMAMAQLSNGNNNTSPTVEDLVESKYDVSDDGKTLNIETGNAVNIKKIASINDSGEVNLTVDDDAVIKASDIAFSSPIEALFIENIGAIKIGNKPISIDSANALYQMAMTSWKNNPNMTANEAMSLIKGLEESYVHGAYNFGRSSLTAKNDDGSAKRFAGELSQEQRNFAYNLGVGYSIAKTKADQKAIDDLKARANKKASSDTTAKKGRVRFEDGVAPKGKLHKRTVALAKHLARAIGVDIVFYDARTTTNEDGKGANGYFDEDTDTIYLDLQNSWDDAKTIVYTMSHELVHFIKKWSPDKFDTFAKFLMEQYGKHGVDASELLSKKMTDLGTEDTDLAYEEMVCDACETMLLDSDAIYKLMELRKTDLELFDKIKLHIHELLNKIRGMYKELGLSPTSDEAKALLEMKDVLEQIYSLFEEAAVDATQSYQAVQNSNETIFGEESIDIGKTESGIKNQLKNHKKIGEDATAYNNRHKNVLNSILQVGIESMYEMAETMLPYLEVDGILPPDIPGKTIFKNGSYGRTGENTTLCVRTLTYEDFKDRVAENLGRPLTVSESLLVSQKIYDIATDPQCIYCYVAADRKAYDEKLGEYWKAMDKYIKAMRDSGDSKALYAEYLAGRKDTSHQKRRWSMWESIAKSGKDYISEKDLTTKRKRDSLIAKKNAFSEQIKDAQRYAQNASWAKTVYDYRAYKGDILKMTSKFVDMLNSEYGLRMYSFSDYTPAFIVENMQMLIDASVKGLKSLAYTKDTDYAEIFASTGQAINVSCFARWDAELGTYVEDNRQGANWEKTKNLRKQYRNVGAVMVATNDAMVEWALKQDWVDVVIPYHIVKTGTTIANEYQWNNYTSESADRIGNKTANIYPTEHNNDFATYSNLLNERGITPRFSKWYDMVASGKLTENQYMKLVNEVRLPASELSAVVPSFNLEAAKRSFGIDNDGNVIKGGFVDKGGYMGGWYREGVDVNQEVMAVSEDIKAGKSSLDVDYGMNKVAKEKVEARYKKQAKKSLMSNSAFTQEEMLNIRNNVVNYFNLKGINGFEHVQKGVLNTLEANGFFDNNGEKKVVIKENGMEVTINRKSIRETFGNGSKYESIPATFKVLKLATIEQIPNIIENADVIVENEKNKYNNGNNKTFTYLRGTATIEGKYVPVRITLKISKEKNKFWVHHVDVTKNADDIFGLGANNANPTDSKLSSAEDIITQDGTESQEKHIKKQLKRDSLGNELSKEQQEFQERVIAAQDMAEEARQYGRRLTVNYDGSVTVYHGTSVENAEKIRTTGTINKQSYFTTKKSEAEYYAKQKNKNGVVLDLHIDARTLEFAAAGAELYSPVELTNINGIYTSVSDIRYQKKRNIAPIESEDLTKLEKHFGTTGNFKVAGYLLTNGKLLDFSGKHWGDTTSRTRQVDHRDVKEVLDDRGNNGFNAMIDMIGNGNIRLMPETGGINLATYPNEKQRRVLSLYIRQMLATEGQVIIDYDTVGGYTVDSRVYKKHASPSQILVDIRNYFQGGRQSELMQFHTMYQKKTTTNRTILAESLESAAQNDIERNKLKQYKEKISLIEKEEQRLSEIQKQLFTKGAVEPEQRKALQFEAKQISNRINTYDRQLLNLESTTALKNVLNREKALARKKQKQIDAEILKGYKEKAAKNVRELMDRNKKSREKATESRNKTAMRHQIQRVVNDLNNLLLKPSKERHVPEEMRIAVAEALEVVNMDTVAADERVAKYNDLIMKAKDPDVIASLTETRDRILAQGNKLSEKLGKLKEAYEMVKESTDLSFGGLYDEVIYNKIGSVQKKVGKTPLRNMTLEQLESVYDLYTAILTIVRDANKAFAEDLRMSRQALGSNTFSEIKENNKSRDRIKYEAIERLGWKNLKPMQAMKTIGSETLQKLWNNVLYGQEVFAQDYDEAVKFAKEMKEKYGYDKWDLNKLYSFESKSGKAMKISLEQMMSIYAYSKRHQADEHIEYGGIVLNEGVIKEKNKLGKVVEVKVNDSTAYRLNKMQVGEIIATLEKEFPGAKDFVDDMQKYLSDTMGAKGNEVSMKMYGIKLFKEEHYFPLKSSKDFMEAANAKIKGDVKIKNKGMTKSTVEHARNPIVLENFLDVWGNHINEMALYHGLVLPLEDFSRTLNYSFKADEKMNVDAESVRTALHDAFGDSADNYLNELLKAINGGVLHDSSAEFADKMISKFKKAKVMASLSVIVQQPTAIIRAMGIIDPKYFVAQNFNHKATWEELKKYCPTAIIKETGSFDTNMGRTIVDMIKDDRSFTDKVGDFLGKAPAYMDEMGWNMIWRALKNKVATEQKLSGEALLKECGKQMTLILNETQVYDSVMARNELMRSKNALAKMATAFMAEPSTVANMIYGAALDLKRGNKGVAAKTVAAVISSVVVNGLVSAMVYALRDDDEDETLLEKYISSATTEVLDGLNPLTYIPFVKDIYSLFQGYKVERTDMALIKDIVDAIDSFYKVFDSETYEGMSGKEIASHIYENSAPLLTSICDMFGLPVGNVLRDAKAIIINDNASKSSPLGTKYAFKEGIMNTLPKIVQKIIGVGTKQDKLYEAIIKGDTAYVDRLKGSYKDEDAYEDAVRKALRENDSRIREAAEALLNGEVSEYDRITKAIIKEGKFDIDDIKAAIKSEYNDLKPDEGKEETADEMESIYYTHQYYDALIDGDMEMADKVKEDIINTEIANGKSEADATDSFNSSFRNDIRDGYAEGTLSREKATDMLVKYAGLDDNEAYWQMDKYDYYAANGTTEGYSKYGEFYEAVKTGKNLKSVIKKYLDHGVKDSTLASQITEYYKPLYIAMTNKERAGIKGYLLNAYALLGKNRAEKSRDIDKWLKEK